MKLLSCHINGFGKYVNKDFDFKEGIESYCLPNGEGKSTLCAFISAMLYGMDTASEGKFTPRSHYLPFNGGAYGGTLKLEVKGKEYTIERKFHEKSAGEKENTLIVNGEKKKSTDKIGETLIGICRDNFEKFCVISADRIMINADGDMKTHFGEFTTGANVDKVIDELEKERKQYSDLKNNESKLKGLKLDEGKLLAEHREYPTVCKELEEANAQLKVLQANYNKANSESGVIAHWNQYEDAILEVSKLENEQKDLLAPYKNGLPTKEEISLQQNTLAEMEKNSTPFTLSENEAKEEKELSEKLTSSPDVSVDIANAEAKMEELTSVSTDMAKYENANFDKTLANRFAKAPTEKEIETLKTNKERYKELNSYRNSAPVSQNPAKKPILPLLIIGAILLVVGLVFLAIKPVVGAISASCGVVVLLLSLIPFLKGGNSVVASSPKDEELAKVHYQLQNYLESYGYVGDVVVKTEMFLEDYNRFLLEQEKEEICKAEKEALQKTYDEITEQLNAIFLPYNLPENPLYEKIHILQNMERDYSKLVEKKKEIDKKEAERKAFVEAKKEQLENFAKCYGLEKVDREILNTLSGLLIKKETLENRIASAKKGVEELKSKYSLTTKPTTFTSEADIALLKEACENQTKKVSELTQRHGQLEKVGENLNNLQDEIAELKEYIDYEKMQTYIYEKTKELIKQANENLMAKYSSPVKELFENYSDAIKNVLGTEVTMKSDFSIEFDVNGTKKPTDHLSTGEFALVSFCFRLAILDKLFEGEKPFVIIDDAFEGVDDKTMAKIAEFIKNTISKDRQILYFTCSTSREIQ